VAHDGGSGSGDFCHTLDLTCVNTGWKLPNVANIRHAVSIDEKRRPYREYLVDHESPADVQEVWFAGVHSDVGGTFVDDHRLADISLKWMVNQAASSGLRLRTASLISGRLPQSTPRERFTGWAGRGCYSRSGDVPSPLGQKSTAASARNRRSIGSTRLGSRRTQSDGKIRTGPQLAEGTPRQGRHQP
jgi:hypothetical protein